jgi:hypothetical protein
MKNFFWLSLYRNQAFETTSGPVGLDCDALFIEGKKYWHIDRHVGFPANVEQKHDESLWRTLGLG